MLRKMLLLLIIVLCAVVGFFAIMGYFAYQEYIDKYVHVEIANCSNAKSLMDDELKELPTLKKALEIAGKEGKATLKISIEEYNKMGGLSGWCVEYKGKTYQIYLITL
jgi:cell division protein FtsL